MITNHISWKSKTISLSVRLFPRVRTHPGKSWKVLEFYCSEFQALESPGKRHRSWKILELYTSGSGIVSSGLSSREADKQFLLIHCHLLGEIEY